MKYAVLALLAAAGAGSCNAPSPGDTLAQERIALGQERALLEKAVARTESPVGRYQWIQCPPGVTCLGGDRMFDTTTGEVFITCDVSSEPAAITSVAWCLLRPSPNKATSDAIWFQQKKQVAK